MGDWLTGADHGRKYGGSIESPNTKASPDASPLHTMGGPTPRDAAGPLNPSSPVFWVLGLAAASLGLIAYSTTIRVGPASASLAVGK